MDSLIVAACQSTPDADPREAALEAARRGARLVVLPAFSLAAGRGMAPDGRATQDSPADRDELVAAAAGIAREAACYLVPGTVLVAAPDGEGLRQVAWLFAPDGHLIGEQTQTHTSAEEEAAGWRRGDTLEVFDVLGARVGLLVGLDAWVPEVSRILALRGATVLIAPLAMPGPYSQPRQLAGLWQEVQQNQTFGLEACLVGGHRGRAHAGRSAIIAPCEMTTDESGFVVRAADEVSPATLVTALDFAARRRVISAYDIFAEFNPGLYRRAFPAAYGEAERADLPRPGPPQPNAAGAATPTPRSGPADSVSGPGVVASVGVDAPPTLSPRLPLSWKEKAFRRYLALASRPGVVRGAVGELGLRPGARPATAPGRSRPERVRVAALQMESFYARSARDYALRVGERFREAVEQGADLVAFPEYVTYPLIGLLPGVEDMSKAKAKGASGGAAGTTGGPGATAGGESGQPAAGEPAGKMPALADVVRFLEPVLRSVYFTLFSALAAAAGVHVMAGSTPMPGTDGKVYNVTALFSPDGGLVGTQRKIHLFPREREEGLSPGSSLSVFETGVGRLALPICMDATYFETYRLAALLGAEMVSAPVSNVEAFNYWKMLRGPWPRVQETPVFAVQSTIVGEFLGDPLTGKATVFAPLELTPAGDGILAQCPEPTGRGLAVADLDLDALAAFRARHPVFSRLNLDLVRRYLPEAYEGRAGRPA